jgi:hypothetical protein
MEDQKNIASAESPAQDKAEKKSFVILETHNTPEKRSFNPVFSAIVIIVFFSLGGFVALFLTGKTEKEHIFQHAVVPTAANPPTPHPTESIQVTRLTQIATSLAVPPLYVNWQWSSEKTSPDSDALTSITVDRYDQHFLKVPMTGSMYTATRSAISNPDTKFVDNYYAIQLKKSGWLVDTGSPYLVFDSFRLRADSASGSCGGYDGYLGYYNSMVRLVSVEHTLQPCVPQTDSTPQTQNIAYTVFIGNPVPLQYFTDYMASHSK